MLKLLIFLVYIRVNCLIVADEVLGCGGYIRSHVPIDFSKVEVRLVTQHGIVKDRTNCAPNNGYYFLPLYDKGELQLEVSPPPGWSFTPNRVELNIDGKDSCSLGKDIDFKFEGFGITGKVESWGNPAGGPEGVTVTLSDINTVAPTRKTITLKDGSFSFSPVYPGSYKVAISNSKWETVKNSVNVIVQEGNTELPPGSLSIKGYEVSGRIITSEKAPVQYSRIVIYDQRRPLNYETFSNHLGEYLFKTVPSGVYVVKPYYEDEEVHFKPEMIDVIVEHSNVKVDENFEVIGFTLYGFVANAKSVPIPKTTILINDQEVTKVDEAGKFKLERLKIGTYKLKAETDNFLFTERILKVDGTTHMIPTLNPAAFKVCGKVVSDKSQMVIFMDKITKKPIMVSTNQYQEFCQFLPSSVYEVQVAVSEEDKKNGLQFFPLSRNIDVLDDTVRDLLFSQLKSTISGSVQCIQPSDCENVNVILKNGIDEMRIPLKDSKYSAVDILPGTYELTLSKNRLCWEKSSHIVNINSETVQIPQFVQSGYQVEFATTHNAVITYHDKKLVTLSIKGLTSTCLSSPGDYVFQITSCHVFQFDKITYSTANDANKFNLQAIKHTIEFSIEAEVDHGKIDILINDKSLVVATYNGKKYSIKLMLKPGEVAKLHPKSDKLFFTPASAQIEGHTDCLDVGTKFSVSLGKVFEGHIQPPLAGVRITINNVNNGEITMFETKANGEYKFAPLDGRFEYKITAEKDSYVFVGPDNKGLFIAQKLAEITVKVLDETDQAPLAGVLLSLSGGQSYRKNLQTDSEGEISFHSLSAGEYFLRPMMKEYQFEPISKIVEINEGETIRVVLRGKRVAFSAFGKLIYLNGDPFENLNVIATGLGNCSHLYEEATSDSGGSFRIRGLQPFCSFKIHVQLGVGEPGTLIDRTSPEYIEIRNINADLKNVRMIAFRPILVTDIVLKLYTDNVDHYKHLKVLMYRETPNKVLIHTSTLDHIRFDPEHNAGILIQVPKQPLDHAQYSVHVEPNHQVKGKAQLLHFSADDTLKLLQLRFVASPIQREQPIKRTSLWTAAFVILVVLVAYNIQTIWPFLCQHIKFDLSKLSTNLQHRFSRKSTVDYDNIDQIVQDINNVRKHKPKKNN